MAGCAMPLWVAINSVPTPMIQRGFDGVVTPRCRISISRPPNTWTHSAPVSRCPSPRCCAFLFSMARESQSVAARGHVLSHFVSGACSVPWV
jgi:hypothetical protein